MAFTSKGDPKTSVVVDEALFNKLEPGACAESVLNSTDSFIEFASDMSTSLLDQELSLQAKGSTINEIQSEIGGDIKQNTQLQNAKSTDDLQNKDEPMSSSETESSSNINENGECTERDEYLKSPELINKEKHVFILSSAGKPIYSRYGNEDKLAGLCGVIQALVSVVEDQNKDVLRSITTQDCKAVFLVKGPLILVAVSKSNESETQLVLQLTYVYNQIVSVLTQVQLTKIFEQRRNYDLRRLLAGAERLIDHVLVWAERDPAFLLGAVRCLPLAPAVRESIASAMVASCGKIRELVFAVLVAGGRLVAAARRGKYRLHAADLHLLLNLVRSTDSFRSAETWTPVCLPHFDATGFLHGHVSYLSEDCQACLLLLTVQRDAFFTLSQAKHALTERLRRAKCLQAIAEALNPAAGASDRPLNQIGVPEIRHFMYKCKATAQYITSDNAPVECLQEYRARHKEGGDISVKKIEKLSDIDYVKNYRTFCAQIHCTATPAKLIFRSNSEDTILAWVTTGFELYVTCDPLLDKEQAIRAVDRLLLWLAREERRLFLHDAAVF